MCRSGPRLAETEPKVVVAHLVLIDAGMRSISNYGPDCHGLSPFVDGAQSRTYEKRFPSIYSYVFGRSAEDSIL